MYVPPFAGIKSQTPQKYTNRARDEINKKLNLNAPQRSSNLRFGSSPLKHVANASDTSLSKVNSHDSIESHESTESASMRSKKSFFGSLNKLRRIGSSQSSIKPSDEEDVVMQDDDSQSSINEPIMNQMPSLHPVPSIISTDSSLSMYSSTSSLQSKQSTTDESLFSNQHSLATQFTNISQYPSAYQQPQSQNNLPSKQFVLTLQEALPTRFDDMYAPELLADPNLLIDGRPLFTRRALLDWDLNDIRSLLIVEKLRDEWNGQIPVIYTPQGFKIEYLPLDADDQTVIKTLVESDIYKEAKFDNSFRVQTAKYTLFTARRRHAQILKNSGLPDYYNTRFSKPEWRNVIENFLLNLAVEAQCRYDFKKVCHDLKKARKQQVQSPVQPSVSLRNNNLLRRAILNEASQSVKTQPTVSTSLTKEEKAQLWTEVQTRVYQRIGLDWAPDPIRT